MNALAAVLASNRARMMHGTHIPKAMLTNAHSANTGYKKDKIRPA
jgi:hypothetical protein